MYPRQLPGTDKVRVNRETEMHQSKDAIQVKGDEDFGKRSNERILHEVYILLLKPNFAVRSFTQVSRRPTLLSGYR